MREVEVDVAVIGAGTAGLHARHAAEKRGAHAVAIDPGPLGTLCARVGCMPSKLLLAAAEAAQAARDAAVFGVHAAPRVDGPAVFARVRGERDRFVGFALADTDDLAARGLLLSGAATFVAEDALEVGELRVKVRRGVVVANGSAPVVPPPLRHLTGARVMHSDAVFELRDVPESVLVVGAGPLGLELGQALRRLGARVTVVGVKGALGGLSDPAVRDAAKASLARELELHTDYKLQHAGEDGEAIVVRFVGDDGHVREDRFERVLLAAGRKPALGGLALDRAGVALGEGGLPEGVDPGTLQAGSTRVFFAGDASAIRPLQHEAVDSGRISGGNAATWPKVQATARKTPLGLVFTDPQLAVVGRPFAAIDPDACAIGQVDFADQGRARVMAKDRGLARIYADRRSGALLGAELAGPHVEHLAHLLAWSIQQGLTVAAALAMPIYHPVLEEGLRTALLDARRRMK